ncbi:MAG: hypothetical protein ACRYG7_25270 [Janthinobacterium lividum]
MLTRVSACSPRHFSPDAPVCFPCTIPAFVSTPALNRFLNRFNAAHVHLAARRCSEVAQQRPTWPQSRVRATIARELNVSTTQLRYLLRQAAGLEQSAPDADAPPLAA